MGAIRLKDDNTIEEVVGEEEQFSYFAEQQWKTQVRQITRWVKHKSNKQLIQCAFGASVGYERLCGRCK